jgi:anti-sigma regulatory factor (Ser/Thr protein kinase)
MAVTFEQGWTATRPALLQEIAPLRRAAAAFAKARGLPQRVVEDVAIGVSEAASNVVVHAFIGVAPGTMTLTAHVLSPEAIRIVVVDDGNGMQLRSDTSGLGLGLALISELAEHFLIEAAPDGHGTSVTMDFGRAA